MKDRKFTHIFFDVGGVVILDFSGNNKWEEMLQSMGVDDENKERFLEVWNKHKPRRCIDFDVDSMIDEFRNHVGLELSEDFSFLDEFVNRFDPNPSIWPVLDYTQQHYKVGLITNMYPRMLDKIFQRSDLVPDISWECIIDSSVVKLQKPNREIYEFAYKKIGTDKDDKVLFIDNSEEHLVVPEKLRWDTFLYDPTNPKSSSEVLLNLVKL
ncbi:MAG TPA: HAD family hydrolase [Candidatus Dojkabacteria bacterium]|nr:HAD family hydrolase [Candidatus Dojkabacteria bacterium]HRO65439.1 HAD family hydrolase [Candidatus Dojkabacteria bacterium]HRP36258.1 HAD family hydrolase [Candidatus Dojkabacteria bacterium]HRP51106.1 HAD family hydrolase [Candidatus Dojkabacteria bacterium]